MVANAKIKNILILILVITAIAGFFWFARFFGSGESAESESPAVICKPQNAPPEFQQCFWTAHIHAHVEIFKNSKSVPVRFEQGELEEEHTHSESNKLHWHGLIPVNPQIKEVNDWSPLRIGAIPKDLKLQIEGKPVFIVNGQEVDPSYVWQDGDHIEIRF